MKLITLSQGLSSKVSDEDFDFLNQWNWSAYRIAGKSHTGKVHLYGHKAGRKYFKDKKLWIHNVLMTPPEGFEVDHINNDPLDNRRENLRVVSHQENCRNRGKRRSQSSSNFVGVTYRAKKSKWTAAIRGGGKTKHLGYFQFEADAAMAYNEAAIQLYGEGCHQNIAPQLDDLWDLSAAG